MEPLSAQRATISSIAGRLAAKKSAKHNKTAFWGTENKSPKPNPFRVPSQLILLLNHINLILLHIKYLKITAVFTIFRCFFHASRWLCAALHSVYCVALCSKRMCGYWANCYMTILSDTYLSIYVGLLLLLL